MHLELYIVQYLEKNEQNEGYRVDIYMSFTLIQHLSKFIHFRCVYSRSYIVYLYTLKETLLVENLCLLRIGIEYIFDEIYSVHGKKTCLFYQLFVEFDDFD
jgi:hypothetical protein